MKYNIIVSLDKTTFETENSLLNKIEKIALESEGFIKKRNSPQFIFTGLFMDKSAAFAYMDRALNEEYVERVYIEKAGILDQNAY